MHFAGLDWSLNSPALTVIDSKNQIHCFFFKKSLKNTKGSKGYYPFLRPDFEGDDLERICYNAAWCLECLNSFSGNILLAIEGSALMAKGKVIDLAENVGAVKFALVNAGYTNLHTIPPTVVKKFATGKGNADKEQMYEAGKKLFELNKLELPSLVAGGDHNKSPVSDIVDSLWLAQYAKQVLYNINAEERQ